MANVVLKFVSEEFVIFKISSERFVAFTEKFDAYFNKNRPKNL